MDGRCKVIIAASQWNRISWCEKYLPVGAPLAIAFRTWGLFVV